MATKPQIIFMHQKTGNIHICKNMTEGLRLGKEWTQIKFVKNEKGERVMRFTVGDEHGNKVTIDVQPTGERVIVDDGKPKSK